MTQMLDHRCFVQHFIICLVVGVLFVFGLLNGIVQETWKTDLSYTTSIIGVLTVVCCCYLGLQAWSVRSDTQPHWAIYVMGVLPLWGILGTTTGLRLNIVALSLGSSGLTPLGTSIATIQAGVIGLIIVATLVFNVEWGARRAVLPPHRSATNPGYV
jgi:hypothetical protein